MASIDDDDMSVVNININIYNHGNIDSSEFNRDWTDLINLFCLNSEISEVNDQDGVGYIYNFYNNVYSYNIQDEGDINIYIHNEQNRNETCIKKRDLDKLYKLPKYYKCDEMNKDCSICMDDIKFKKEYIRKLNCGHYFHKKCIDTWLTNSLSCPMCRSIIEQKVD